VSRSGSAFVDAWLLRACAVLGVKLTHSTPGRPQGRGKIERFFGVVRDQFLVEITGDPAGSGRRPVASIAELNRLFTAWTETVYHRRAHSETGQAPSRRWADGWKDTTVALPGPAQLHEAFLWSERRTVRKTATVSLHGNTYQVDPSLALRKVELVFDPFDLTSIEVRWQGRPAGKAVPHVIGRHSHPKARPEQPAPPAPATGIDYMGLIDAAHDTRLAAGAISFAGLTSPATPAQLPGQLTIDEAIAQENQ
jgi:putative transposase